VVESVELIKKILWEFKSKIIVFPNETFENENCPGRLLVLAEAKTGWEKQQGLTVWQQEYEPFWCKVILIYTNNVFLNLYRYGN